MMFYVSILVGVVVFFVILFGIEDLVIAVIAGLGLGLATFGLGCLAPLEYHYTNVYEQVSVEEFDTHTVTTSRYFKENPWLVPFGVEMGSRVEIKVHP